MQINIHLYLYKKRQKNYEDSAESDKIADAVVCEN